MRSRGFTLVELVVTVAILGVLALGVLPLAELTVKRAKENELRVALRQIRGAIDDYKRAHDQGRIARAADASGYPPSLEALVDGVVDAKDVEKRRIHFLRRLPRDPMTDDGAWGLRSYASGADDPRPGSDVYDVHSRSEASGIDGVPYRRW